jgi:hypothetical protein
MTWFVLQLAVNLNSADLVEFCKSYFQIVTSSIALYILWLNSDSLKAHASYLSAMVLIPTLFFTVVQVGELLIFGTSQSWFWLGDISITTATDAGRFQAVNFLSYIRPTAQYHEPSYLALVAFCFYCIQHSTHVSANSWIKSICLILVFVSFSATVWLLALMFILLFQLGLRTRLLTVLAVALLAVPLELYDFFRISEIFTYGTSAWHRIGKPLIETSLNINAYPFGVPLGNTRFVFDNSVLLMASYFGVLFLFAIPVVVFVSFIYAGVRIPLFFLLAAMMVNGAIITIESVILVGLVFIVFSRPRRKVAVIRLGSSTAAL